jgi:hypothetical protein
MNTRALRQTQEDIAVSVRPVNESNWKIFPNLQTRLQWDEPLATWGLLSNPSPRDVTLPLVPLPSFEVTIQNRSQVPLSFAASELIVEDSLGHRYPVLTDVAEYLPQLYDRLLAETPELYARRPAGGTLAEWPPTNLAPQAWMAPLEMLKEDARKVPLLTSSVEVAPGATWIGALVIRPQLSSSEELAKTLNGQLLVHLAGIRQGERDLPTRTFSVALEGRPTYVTCSDGRKVGSPNECARLDGYAQWIPDGPCLQQGEVRLPYSTRTQTARWLDGDRITNTEAYDALLRVPASHAAAVRGFKLRVAGFALIGAGLLGTVGAAAGIAAGAHDSKDAPAAVSLLAISGVGAVLAYLGHRSELESLRRYNQYAFTTGACARPL